MKCISKNREPARFSQWKVENAPLKLGYSDLHSDVKRDLHTTLIEEQGGICCYCESRISAKSSHIEHFCPQRGDHACSERDLDYHNMFASCQRGLKAGEPRHCGSLKDDWFDESTLISPLDSNCENRFHFSYDGTIYPADSEDQAAKITVEKLGLAIDKLCKLREAAIIELEELSQDDVKQILAHRQAGHFQAYFTTIRMVLI